MYIFLTLKYARRVSSAVSISVRIHFDAEQRIDIRLILFGLRHLSK
jgi:hypothetical protein